MLFDLLRKRRNRTAQKSYKQRPKGRGKTGRKNKISFWKIFLSSILENLNNYQPTNYLTIERSKNGAG